MYKLYGIIATISIIIRQFVLPNPFEPLGETFTLTINKTEISLTPTVTNWIAEPFLHVVTFILAGIYYSKGQDEPAFGSFLYLLFYAIHVGLIYLISLFDFSWIAITIVLVLYITAHIGINVLRNTPN